MLADISERCNTIEECYEFMLAYAAQGLPSDEGSQSGGQIREYLGRAVRAMSGLAESCATAVKQERLEPAQRYHAFFAVLARDASDSLAAAIRQSARMRSADLRDSRRSRANSAVRFWTSRSSETARSAAMIASSR